MTAFNQTAPLPDGITLLEASAGTGKTHSITSIVLLLVAEEKIPLENILIVTFTEAATAELRDRVRRRLRDARTALVAGQRGAAPDGCDEVVAALFKRAKRAGGIDDAVRAIGRALERYDVAPIRTIHGFCQTLLRDFAFECAAEVDGNLLTDDAVLLDEIAHDFWAREVAPLDGETLSELRADKNLTFKGVSELVRLAVRYADAVPVPASPEELAPRAIKADQGVARTRCQDSANALAASWTTSSAAVAAGFHEGLLTNKLHSRTWNAANLTARLSATDRWASDPTIQLPEELGKFAQARRSSIRARMTLSCMDELETLESNYAETTALQQPLLEVARLNLLALRHRCVRYAREQFASRKRERRLQTFDDLLRQVRAALLDPAHGHGLVRAVQSRYQVALVDEFQDTDEVQWEIFRRLFGDGGARLVLIGDPKQSIYAFRGADFDVYRGACTEADQQFSLATNRRSDEPLVKALNALFGRHPMPMALPDVNVPAVKAYHAEVRVRGDGAAPFRIRLFQREGEFASDKGPGVLINKVVLEECLPVLVAADIARTLAGGAQVCTNDVWRPVLPGDCAVLVRKGKQARAMQLALRDKGIPSVLSTDESVFESDEANELRIVFAAILEPSNARQARAALATDLLGITAATELSASSEWTGPQPAGIGDFLEATERNDLWLELWLERLRSWRTRWERQGMMPMLRVIMRETSLPERLVALPDGERRLTNLLHLAELLHTASVDEHLDPALLYEWLVRRRAEADDGREDTRRIRLESDADAVLLVTIHKSKGLEYPFVWCPWAWDGRMWPRSTQPSIARIADRTRVIALEGENDEYLAKRQDDEFAENLRLFYVAITRARHRCTVWWGGAKDAESSALGFLLHGVSGENTGEARLTSAVKIKDLLEKGDDTLRAELRTIVRPFKDLVSIEDEDADPRLAPQWESAHATGPELAVRPWTRRAPLNERWRVGSFTSMTRDARTVAHDADAPEAILDAKSNHPVPDEVEIGLPALLANFPRNAKAGIALHGIFEHADFAEGAELNAIAETQLLQTGFDAPLWTEPVVECVREALDTELVGPFGMFRLRDIPVERRLDELAFSLPVCGGFAAAGGPRLGASELAEAFHDHCGGAVPDAYAERLATLPFSAFRGFLSGAMDLVTEHDGRWYLIDYKSNHLGALRADYGVERLAAEVVEAHYVLQYHLYLVALDRWLALRIPDYDWDTHMGGVFYLFLRGMSCEPASSTGVYADLPPRGRIEAMSQVIFGEKSGAIA